VGEFDHIVAAMKASPLIREFEAMARSEDFSKLDRNTAKRHHYVPQFVLRGFADPRDGGRRVFQMPTKSRKAPRRVGVRDAALRQLLYRMVTKDGEVSNRHEGYLALIEKHAALAIDRLCADAHPPANGDRATIALFIAVQTMRTPVAAEQITTVANVALQHAVSEYYSDQQAFAESYRQRHGDEKSEEEVEAFRREIVEQVRSGKVRLSGHGGADFATGLQFAAKLLPHLIAFDWTLLRTADGGFVTSDRAYAIHDPAPPVPWAMQGILSSPASETLFPFSDKTALLMRPGSATCGFETREVAASELERLNLRMLGWADEYVFAKCQSTLDSLRVAARRQPRDVIRPRPLTDVVLLEIDPDDPSLAAEHKRRGWPPHLSGNDGKPHDYLVIPTDTPQPELRRRADELAERRGRKRLGPAAEGVAGNLSHIFVDPARP
jgi:hypothetical protein